MKTLLVSFLFGMFALSVSAAPSNAVTSGVVGTWAIKGAEFRGEVLVKGEAIYIDTDDVGGFLVAGDHHLIGVRMVMTSYDASTRTLGFNFTERGKVVAKGMLVLDPERQTLIFAESPMSQNNTTYVRQSSTPMSSFMRKSLGLEPKKK